MSIVSPAAGATVSGAVTLRATATDNVGVTGVTFWSGSTRLGTAIRESSTGDWIATVNSRSYPNGTYSVTARATDAAGNTGVSAPRSMTLRN